MQKKKINAGWNIYLSNTEIRPHLNTEIRPHLLNEQRYIYLIRHIDAFEPDTITTIH